MWLLYLCSYCLFPCRIETRPNRGGRSWILSDQQEQTVVNLVWARKDIRPTEIGQHFLEVFNSVEAISLPTIARVLTRNQISLKQPYSVLFERNAYRVKQLRTVQVKCDQFQDFINFISFSLVNIFLKCPFRGWWSRMLMKTITNSYFWKRQALTWPREGGQVRIELASGQSSKYLDNMEPISPCVWLYLKMVW